MVLEQEMSRGSSKIVTVLGSAYFEPISNLVEKLIVRKYRRSNKVQSGYYEHGYSASIILLLVAMFESYVSRLRFVQGGKVPNSARTALDVVVCVYPNLRHKKSLEEVYVVRDLLIHNHLWEVDYEYGGSPSMVLRNASKHPAYGDRKFRDRVNLDTMRTKAQQLHVLPTCVDRRDVVKVFDIVWKTLLVFESTDRFQCYVSHEHVRFNKKTRLFSELRDEICRTL